MGSVKITQTRSAIGRNPAQRRTLKTLGLNKIGRSVVKEDSPSLRGMLNAVSHLIRVEGVRGSSSAESLRSPDRKDTE